MDPSAPPIQTRIPFYFRLARDRIAAGKRGGYLLLHAARRLGLLNQCAPFELPNGETIVMPLDWPLIWRKDRFETYEPDAIQRFAAVIEEMATPPTLVDCGADVGLFTRLVIVRTRRISEVIAIEPNYKSHRLLSLNLQGLPVPARALHGGVGAECGFADLVQADIEPGSDYADHSAFLKPSTGGIRVFTIDSIPFDRSRPLALKIDVEGAELDTVKGAVETLYRVPELIVQFEAHRDVWRRTETDPMACVRLIQSIRPVTIVAFEERTRSVFEHLDVSRPFFDQVGAHRVLDVIIRSEGQVDGPR